MRQFLSLLFILTLASVSHGKIIGKNDLVPSNGGAVNLPAPVRAAVDTVGLMNMGCTGTHIGSNLVISAAHCFLNLFIPQIMDNLTCPNVQITWGVRGDRRGMVSNCTRIVAIEFNQYADWVVFEVDRAPYAYAPVNNQESIQPNQVLTILSHPEAEPLRWSKICRAIPTTANRIGPYFVHHQCDTLPGSSGAPIFDMKTMSIVAIHNGGDNRINYGTRVERLPWERIIAKARIRSPLRPLPGSVF